MLEEFKKEAVGYSLSSEKTVEEVEHDLSISVSNLIRWVSSTKNREELAFPSHSKEKLTLQEQNLRKLQKGLVDNQIDGDNIKVTFVISKKGKSK